MREGWRDGGRMEKDGSGRAKQGGRGGRKREEGRKEKGGCTSSPGLSDRSRSWAVRRAVCIRSHLSAPVRSCAVVSRPSTLVRGCVAAVGACSRVCTVASHLFALVRSWGMLMRVRTVAGCSWLSVAERH